MICPSCKSEIDRDSFFCDQCGTEILICPVCKNPGKGKRCTQDGGKLIPAKDSGTHQTTITQTTDDKKPVTAGATPAQQPKYQQFFVGTSIPVPQPGEVTAGTKPAADDQWEPYYVGSKTPFTQPGQPATTPLSMDENKLTLINNTLGIKIDLRGGDIIGRKAGNFTSVFGKFNQISGKHAQVTFDNAGGFSITDLGSSNGTKYNGTPLIPNQPQVLGPKGRLLLANIEFIVEIAAAQDSDATVRV